MNWLPMFAIKMLQIKLFIFLNRCFIIIIQHLYTMRKYQFAPLIVLSSVICIGVFSGLVKLLSFYLIFRCRFHRINVTKVLYSKVFKFHPILRVMFYSGVYALCHCMDIKALCKQCSICQQ